MHMRPPTLSEFDVEFLDTEHFTLVSPGASGVVTDQDSVVNRQADAIVDNYFELAASVFSPIGLPTGVTLEVDGSAGSLYGNRLNRVSNGTVRVFAKTPWLNRQKTFVMARTGGAVYDELIEHVEGSLARNIIDGMTSRVAGKNSSHMPVFTTQNHATSTYVRNPNCWVADVDWSAVSPWNNYGGAYLAGVAVSPIHVLHAGHASIINGTDVRFVTPGNTVITRTVESNVVLAGGIATDVQVAKLSSELPGTISPAKVFPSTLESYLPKITQWHLPAVGFDAEEKANACEVRHLSRLFNNGIRRVYLEHYTSPPFASVSETIISGDSGNPVFFIVNNEPVLLGMWVGSLTTQRIHQLHAEINAAMTALGGGYQLTPVDLSGFPSYA